VLNQFENLGRRDKKPKFINNPISLLGDLLFGPLIRNKCFLQVGQFRPTTDVVTRIFP
jgi:hypothetical protein